MRRTSWLMSILCASLFGSTAATAEIFAQRPCELNAGRCGFFDQSTNPIPLVRAFDFDMATPGSALVRFDGMLQCEFNSHDDNGNVIDIATRILSKPGEPIDHTSAGGARHAMRFIFPSDREFAPSTAVNLASSRVIRYANPGRATVMFMISLCASIHKLAVPC